MYRSCWPNVTGTTRRGMKVSLQICPGQTEPRLVEVLKASLGQFVQHFRIIRRALGHPHVPGYAKLVATCVVGYVLSPIQLIPSFIPIVGQLDDVLVVGLGISLLNRWVPPAVLEDCQQSSKRNISTPRRATTVPRVNSPS